MQDRTAKVVILGDTGVGKSCIILRIVNNDFHENIQSTLGGVYFEKLYKDSKDKVIKFQFWDTAGQQKFRSIARLYFKDAAAVILVYDVSRRITFEGLKMWINDVQTHGPENVLYAIVGNKTDLLQHQVSLNQGQTFASQKKAIFTLTSAKENKGINDLMQNIISELEKKYFTETQDNNIVFNHTKQIYMSLQMPQQKIETTKHCC